MSEVNDGLSKVVELFQMKAWYPLVALLLTFVIQLAKTKSPLLSRLFRRIPDGWRWLGPALLGFASAFVGVAQTGQPWFMALAAGVGGALGIGVPAMGWNAALTESPIPWNGGSGGKA